MRREGRVTGYVSRRSDESRSAREEYERQMQGLGFTGPFKFSTPGRERIKLLNKATNESKDSSRCRRSRCLGCHACPTSKALVKTKGRNKPRCSWQTMGRTPLPHPNASFSKFCAVEALIDLYDSADEEEEFDAHASEEIAFDDVIEHCNRDVCQIFSSINGDSVTGHGEDMQHSLSKPGVAHQVESDASEFLTAKNCTDDFVIIDNDDISQDLPKSSSSSDMQNSFAALSLHPCDADGFAEWYQVTDRPDELNDGDDDDWHLIID